jgi:hypothetical protein
MRPALTYDSLHNPFHNRFNDPVTSRRDEMQAYAYEVWLRKRDQGNYKTQTNPTASPTPVIASKQATSGLDALDPTHWGRLFASGVVLFLVLLASAAVLKAF